MNAYMLLHIPAMIVPDQEIITFKERRLSYSDLVENAGKLAASLEKYGIGPGDRVGLIATNSPEMIEAFFASFQLGAAIVPINYRAKSDEFEHMIQDCGIKVLILEDRYANLIEPLLPNSGIEKTVVIGKPHTIGSTYEEFVSQSEPYEGFADVDSDDLAILLYTSGTTSKPKGVMLTYGQITTYVMNHQEVADGTPRGSSLLAIPGYHVAGATSICNSIYHGRRLVLISQFEAGEWLSAVEKEKVNNAFLVPTMMKQALDHPKFASTDLNSLENVSYGAAPMPLPVIEEAIELFPKTVNFANAFGMTETTSTVSVLGPEDHKLEGTPEEIEKKIVRLSSVGKPLPGVDIMVLDEDDNIVGPNTIGHVYVRTERSMKGYWKRDEETKKTLVDGWVNTEDMGWIDDDNYLFLGGRNSDMIIRGGENISPAEIEDVLLSHPEIADVAVIGIPSIEWGEEIMAIVVVKEPEDGPTEEEVIEFCREKLSSFKRPSNISFVNDLPRTSTGKILKRELRDQFEMR